MCSATPELRSFLLEDVFDRPGEAAAAGTDFLAIRRLALAAGSPLLSRLAQAGMSLSRVFPSMQFLEGDKGNSPLALALVDGDAELAVGLDEGTWLRLAAVRHGLYAFRFYHSDWLGRGCVAASADLSGVGCLAKNIQGLRELGHALIESVHLKGIAGLSILDMGDALPQSVRGAAQANDLRGTQNIIHEPETAAWLFQRWKGAEMAHWVLASREAHERLRQWIGGSAEMLPEGYRMWLQSGTAWGEDTAHAARAKQAEIQSAYQEVFQRFDAIAVPLVENARFADGVPAWGRLNSPVDLAQLPACVLPAVEGGSVMLVFPSMERLCLP